MADDLAALAARVEALHNQMAPAPWNESALYSAIRHVQRNTDVMENTLDLADPGEPQGLPDRYDGTPLAQLRNMLPEIIAALRAHAASKEPGR